MKGILHLSDLHLSIESDRGGFKWNDAEIVANRIIADVAELQKINNFTIDTIFFTGDMTFSGTHEQFNKFSTHFINVISNKLGVKLENIYYTPGNHDIDRNKVKFLEKTLRNNSPDDIESYFDIVNQEKETWPRLEAYNDFNKKNNSLKNNIVCNGFLSTCYKITNKLYLLNINSSWLAMDDKDRGLLRITKKQLEYFERTRIPKEAKIIAITHHPLDWLNESDRDIFSTFIEKNVDMLFHGHMHSFKQKGEINFNEGITLFLQAGTLDSREESSGYSIVVLNSENNISDGRIYYRKYIKERESFDAWLDRGHGGQIDFSTSNTLSFDTEKFSKLSSEILDDINKDLLINIGIQDDKKKKLTTLFTEPNFTEIETYCLKSKPLTVCSDIYHENNSFVIFGGSSSGRTSLLKYMFIKCLEKQVQRDFSEFSFYLDIAQTKLNNVNSIIIALCQQYFSPSMETSFEEKIKKMINSGSAVIYMDNIDKISLKQQKIISDFISQYKKCRYIITSEHSNMPQIASMLHDDNKPPFFATAIGSLRRRNVRDIVSRWHGSTLQNTIYKEITRTINNSQLPHNYFIYSMLLAIYEVDHDIKGILSESDIIENFIEILLRKHFMDTPPNKPQFKELLHFLGFLASNLFERKDSSIEHNSLMQVAITFNQKTMNDYLIEDYITPLKNSGILRLNGTSYEFSQPCFLYYSIAYFMGHDENLRNSVLSDNNYLMLDKVVEYYSSQNASNLDILYNISEKTKKIKFKLEERMLEEKGIRISELNIENANTFSILDVISSTSDFERKIETMKADRERDDENLDTISPLNDKNKKANLKDEKASLSTNLISNLVDTLSLYARVFRSTELSMDKSSIMNIFDDLLDGYMFYLKSAMIFLDESFAFPIIMPLLEKKMSEDNLTQEEKDEMFEIFKLIISLARSSMPNNVQMIMSAELHSKKPRIANIINEAKNSNNNPIEKAILSYVLMDIKEENILKLASEVIMEKNKIVQESLFFKLNQVVTSKYDLSTTDAKTLKNMIIKIGKQRKLYRHNKISDVIGSFTSINK
ncbi:metallophosphoesterase [Citrobacter freundii]|uniref:metallophosphoesterase n=1 Tax=Citrobacter freundii TaxID=546 RepID=UPI0034D422FE